MTLTKEFYYEHYNTLYWIGHNMFSTMPDREEVTKDAVHDTFERWLHLDVDVKNDRYVLVRIHKNVCIDYLRKHNRTHKHLIAELEEDMRDYGSYYDHKLITQLVMERLQKESPVYRGVFELRFFHGFKGNEIREMDGFMHLTGKAVQSTYSATYNRVVEYVKSSLIGGKVGNTMRVAKAKPTQEFVRVYKYKDLKTGKLFTTLERAAAFIGEKQTAIYYLLQLGRHPRIVNI